MESIDSIFFGEPKQRKVDRKRRVCVPKPIRDIILNRNKSLDETMRSIIFLVRQQPSDSRIPPRYTCYAAADYYGRLEEFLKLPKEDSARIAYFTAKKTAINTLGRISLPPEYEKTSCVSFIPNGDCFIISPYPASGTDAEVR